MSDRHESIGQDSVENRIQVAIKNRELAIEVDSRWNWYLTTIPLIAVGLAMRVEYSNSIGLSIFHLLTMIILVLASVTGILSQWYRSKSLVLIADVDIKIAQITHANLLGGLSGQERHF